MSYGVADGLNSLVGTILLAIDAFSAGTEWLRPA
jgi:hypothetical protein